MPTAAAIAHAYATVPTTQHQQALIKEELCIGCTKCITACPFDAIIGAAKCMHTIITEACTGCGLCIEPCPVDCIDLVAKHSIQYSSTHAKQRFVAKTTRQKKTKNAIISELQPLSAIAEKQAEITAAVARVHAKREALRKSHESVKN